MFILGFVVALLSLSLLFGNAVQMSILQDQLEPPALVIWGTNRGSFENITSLTEVFSEGYFELEEWYFLELSGALGEDIRGKIYRFEVNLTENNDATHWRTTFNLTTSKDGNSFLRVIFKDNTTTRDPVPEFIANELGIPLDQRNQSRWEFVRFENGSYFSTTIVWLSRHFIIGFTNNANWSYPLIPRQAFLEGDMRVSFHNDQAGKYVSNHTAAVVNQVDIWLSNESLLETRSISENVTSFVDSTKFTSFYLWFTSFNLRSMSRYASFNASIVFDFVENENNLNQTGDVFVDIDNLNAQFWRHYTDDEINVIINESIKISDDQNEAESATTPLGWGIFGFPFIMALILVLLMRQKCKQKRFHVFQ